MVRQTPRHVNGAAPTPRRATVPTRIMDAMATVPTRISIITEEQNFSFRFNAKPKAKGKGNGKKGDGGFPGSWHQHNHGAACEAR